MAGRIELKYLVDPATKERLLARWRPYLVAAPYTDELAMYPIMSLYFDSPSLRFYDEKLEGEALRSKVRLRGYGYDWQALDPCILEVKGKVNQRILKFRKNLGPFRPEYLHPAHWPLDDDPSAGPVRALALRHRLRPAVQVLYRRETYESPFCPGLRVAFDSQLLALEVGELMTPDKVDDIRYRCLPEDRFVFEIKSNGGLPTWILQGIHDGQVLLRSISKYVLAIEKLNLHRREMGVYA